MSASGRIININIFFLYILLAMMPGSAWALRILSDGEPGSAIAAIGGSMPLAIWPPNHRSLTYWIDSKEFCGWRGPRTEPCERENIVAASLAEAAKDWHDSCPECGVSFVRVNDKNAATFTVRYVTAVTLKSGRTRKPKYHARSFFRTSESKNRILRISQKYFLPSTDKVGVLRHEFGHILGYTHENTCAGERSPLPLGQRSVAVTQIDGQSVMNSPCEGQTASIAMTLSPMDVAGHKTVYGPASK